MQNGSAYNTHIYYKQKTKQILGAEDGRLQNNESIRYSCRRTIVYNLSLSVSLS